MKKGKDTEPDPYFLLRDSDPDLVPNTENQIFKTLSLFLYSIAFD
jgi:hypothetical protein